MLTKEQLDAVAAFLLRVGIPTAFATVLLWHYLTQLDSRLDKALDVQAKMATTIAHCCHHLTPE